MPGNCAGILLIPKPMEIRQIRRQAHSFQTRKYSVGVVSDSSEAYLGLNTRIRFDWNGMLSYGIRLVRNAD